MLSAPTTEEASRSLVKEIVPYYRNILLSCLIVLFSGNGILFGMSKAQSSKSSSLPVQETLKLGGELICAAIKGNRKEMRRLLDKGVSVDFQSPSKLTSLSYAVYYGHEECVKELFNRGADSHTGICSAYQIAHLEKRKECQRLFSRTSSSKDATIDEQRWSPIHRAALFGDKARLKKLLKNKGAGTVQNTLGETPLHLAALSGSCACMKLVADCGADYRGTTKKMKTIFHYAAQSGSVESIELCLLWGLSVNERNLGGKTPLDYAVGSQSLEAVQLLLECTESTSSKKNRSFYPLRKAIKNDNVALLAILEKRYPLDRSRSRGKPSFLHYAAKYNAVDCMRYLLKKKLPQERSTYWEELPIHYAAQYSSPEMLQLLLTDTTVSINARDKHGITPLFYAARAGHLENMMCLLDKGASVQYHQPHHLRYSTYYDDYDDTNLLQETVNGGSLACVLLCLDKDCDLDQIGSSLSHAIRIGEKKIAQVLIEREADVNGERNWSGLLCVAMEEGDKEFAYEFIRRGADIMHILSFDPDSNMLHLAAAGGSLELFKVCLEHNLNVYAKNFHGCLPLQEAARAGSYDILAFLLNHEEEQFAAAQHKGLMGTLASTFSKKTRKLKEFVRWQRNLSAEIPYPYNNLSLLHLAVQTDSIDCVALCLNRGLSPNIRTKDKITPLMCAASKGSPQIVILLLSRSADMEAKNSKGQTPLFYATSDTCRYGIFDWGDCTRFRKLSIKEQRRKFCEHEKKELEKVSILLEHGANIHARDNKKNTPLHSIIPGADPYFDIIGVSIVEKLLACGANIHAQNTDGISPFLYVLESWKNFHNLEDFNFVNIFVALKYKNTKKLQKAYLKMFIDAAGSSMTRPVCGEILLKRVLRKQSRSIVNLFLKRSYHLFAPVLADVQESYERVIAFIGVSRYYRDRHNKLATLTVYPVLYVLCSLNETADDVAKIVLHHLNRKDTDPRYDFSHLLPSDAQVLLTSEESKTMVVDYIVKRLRALCTEICDEEQGPDSLDDTRRLLLDPLLVSDTFGEVIREGIAQRFEDIKKQSTHVDDNDLLSSESDTSYDSYDTSSDSEESDSSS